MAARDLFQDLLSLEINTIVKPGMTARKMPPLGHAMLDVFSDYDFYVCGRVGHLNPVWEKFLRTPDADRLKSSLAKLRESTPPQKSWLLTEGGELIDHIDATPFYDEENQITAREFYLLRTRARTADEMVRTLVEYGRLSDDGTRVLLKRIHRNSDEIRKILERREAGGRTSDDSGMHVSRKQRRELAVPLPDGISRETAGGVDFDLTSEELLVIRKAWEVGTETILMQTVAQLDGDFVTRVQPGRIGQHDDGLHALHRLSTAGALQHWQFLIRTAQELTSRFLSG